MSLLMISSALNTHELARIGFLLVRNLLQGRIHGGTEAALDLADALHNFPENGNEVRLRLTLARLEEVIEKHPQLQSWLAPFVSQGGAEFFDK